MKCWEQKTDMKHDTKSAANDPTAEIDQVFNDNHKQYTKMEYYSNFIFSLYPD